MDMDTLVLYLLFGFVGVMLLLPFGILLGMALPRKSTSASSRRRG